MPKVSFIVPARDEEDFIESCLDSIKAQQTDRSYEIIVVDGRSTDNTVDKAKAAGATVIEQDEGRIGAGRDLGAQQAAGDWYVFIDADTVVEEAYLDTMLRFIEEHELVGASARCRMPGIRSKIMQGSINHVLARLPRPVLPGFNIVVESEAYHAVDGFSDVPNEDTDFSRRLAAYGETAYYPEQMVKTSSRRIKKSGLTGTLYHYVKLDIGRIRRMKWI